MKGISDSYNLVIKTALLTCIADATDAESWQSDNYIMGIY